MAEAEGAAIRSLGPLFRVTEVFLWDDACGDVTKASSRDDNLVEESSAGIDNQAAICLKEFSPLIIDDSVIEDLEVAQEMSSLGLPVSFSTNKEKRKTGSGGKRKGMKGKLLSARNASQSSVSKLCSMENQEQAHASSQDCQFFHEVLNISPDCTIEESQNGWPCNTAKEMHAKDNFLLGGELVTDRDSSKEQAFCKADEVTSATRVMNVYVNEKGNINLKSTEVVTYPSVLGSESYEEDSVENGCHGCSPQLTYGPEKVINSKPTFNLSCTNSSQDNFVEMEAEESCQLISLESAKCSVEVDHGIKDVSADCECPDSANNWVVVWDMFYKRYYYYNSLTEESTWYAPPGLENLAFAPESDEVLVNAVEYQEELGFACTASEDTVASEFQKNDSILEAQNDGKLSRSNQEVTCSLEDTKNQLSLDGLSISNVFLEHASELNESEPIDKSGNTTCLEIFDASSHVHAQFPLVNGSSFSELNSEDEFRSSMLHKDFVEDIPESHHCFDPTKKKKKLRRIRSCQRIICIKRADIALPEEMEGFSPELIKYWHQRYSLFSRFDHGIKMDEEGWFSVTPELIAKHQASRCGIGIVIDCFTGVGGNAIQFATRGNHVIAIDIDPHKIESALHNATIYGVHGNIDFIQGDFFHIAPRLKGDIVFLSPPWGGPDYLKVQTYDIRTMLQPLDGFSLFKVASMVAPKVVMFLPRNVDLNQLAELSLSAHSPWELEVEKNYLNGKLKAITAYFSDTSREEV